MKKATYIIIILTIISTLLSEVSSAASYTIQNSFYLSQEDYLGFKYSFNVNQWSPTVAEEKLDSVEVSYKVSSQGFLCIHNMVPIANSAAVSFNHFYDLSFPEPSSPIQAETNFYSGIINMSPDSIIAGPPANIPATEVASYVDPAPFVGDGTIPFQFIAKGIEPYGDFGSGGFWYIDEEIVYCDVFVTYNTTMADPVPEPSTFLLLGFGLTGLVWLRKKLH